MPKVELLVRKGLSLHLGPGQGFFPTAGLRSLDSVCLEPASLLCHVRKHLPGAFGIPEGQGTLKGVSNCKA